MKNASQLNMTREMRQPSSGSGDQSITELMCLWRAAQADVQAIGQKVDELYTACKRHRRNSRKWKEAQQAVQDCELQVFDKAVSHEFAVARLIARTRAQSDYEQSLKAETVIWLIEGDLDSCRPSAGEEAALLLADDMLRRLKKAA